MINSKIRQGILWALATALVSGVSVYVNTFASKAVGEPFVFTTLKNTLVAGVFSAAILSFGTWRQLKGLSRRKWLQLALIGLIGGSIPFLLFFYGLSLATAASAGLIHKTLFLWVALLAVPILKEKLGLWPALGLLILIIGQLMFNLPKAWGWKSGEAYILIATMLWAAETIVLKRVLNTLSPAVTSWARMTLGLPVMWAYLWFSGKLAPLAGLGGADWRWIALTAVLLTAYVFFWHRALKHAPAIVVTSVLTVGALITTTIAIVRDGTSLAGLGAWGLVLTLAGVAVLSLFWRKPDERQA